MGARKNLILLIALSVQLFTSAQEVLISQSETDVYLDAEKYLFLDADNPISINKGRLKKVSISITGGTLKPSNEAGKYFVRPYEYISKTIITLTSGKRYRKDFIFRNKELPYPEALISGPRDDHGIITSVKETRGVMAVLRNFPIEVRFKVDSFTVTLLDSSSQMSHKNIGAAWDETTRELISNGKPGNWLLITDIHVTGTVRKYALSQTIRQYFY